MTEKLGDAITRRARSRVGTVLRDKWTLERVLGVGGTAAVFAATHRNGKLGAVKMLHPELNLDEDARHRFLREGYVANKVGHPGAVSVVDDDVTEDGSVFLVMELLEGATVDTVAKARLGRKLDVSEVLSIAVQLLDVLVAAHDKGIVHRDLKPANLFITASGELKVLDFGIARLRELSSARSATQTGEVMGTPAYMPPEQALGNWDAVDARTDVWAVGATMFSLLTGRTVHEASTTQKLMLAAMTKPAPLIQTILPTVAPALAGVINRALMFEQAERWPSARAMQAAVEKACAEASIPFSSRRAQVGAPAVGAGDVSTSPTVKRARGAAGSTRGRTLRLALSIGATLVVAICVSALVVASYGRAEVSAAPPLAVSTEQRGGAAPSATAPAEVTPQSSAATPELAAAEDAAASSASGGAQRARATPPPSPPLSARPAAHAGAPAAQPTTAPKDPFDRRE